MPKATFDKSRLLELHARIGQTGVPIILTFLNEDGTARAIDEEDFLLRVKKRPSSPTAMFDLEIGSGLTVIGPELNKLKIELSEENSDQDPDTNFYTLLSVEENHTWLNGPFKFHNGEYDGVEITDEITIAENGVGVTITVTSGDGTSVEAASQSEVNTGTATGVYVSPKTLAEKVEVITASGTNTYTATIPGTLTSGRRVYVKFTNANTGASTLNGTAIKKSVNTALASGDIASGEVKLLAYDGTNFQVVGGSGSGSATPSINVEGGTERKISAMTALTAANVANTDLIPIVDISDTTDAASGTNKKMTVAEMKKLVGRIVLHKNTNIVVGGGTSETLVYSFLIPGGTLLAGDVLEIAAVFSKTGAAGNGIMKFKLHTLNQLSGAKDVAYMQVTANASLYNETFRRIFLKGSNSAELMFPYVVATGAVSSETLNQTTTGLNPAVNFANDSYFIVSLQRSSGADSVTMESLVVEIIR